MSECKNHYAAMYNVRMGLASCPFCKVTELEAENKRLREELEEANATINAIGGDR